MENQKIPIIYSEEVSTAILNKQPIVALESTIITHGMEYPANYETAAAVEQTVRDNGAIPATIVILNGVIRIGLTNDEIKEVSQSKTNFIKCTTRDIPYALLAKLNGSTTVAATMYIANIVGIKVFVTGGIGGVHFGDDMDISADLYELSKTPVTVVCAGVKAILDIPRTLEFLETYSVPVIGYDTGKFPEFFFSEGDNNVRLNLKNDEECAKFINMTHDVLKMKCGILVAVPVPKESEANKELVKAKIGEALAKCKQLNIRGADITPFLLKEVNQLTGGESCKANIALIINNAKVGAKIAHSLNYNLS